jgi:hypothetical protein
MAEPSRAFENASIRTRLSELGATAIAGSPVQFGFIAEEIEKYASVILSAKTKGTGSETLSKGPLLTLFRLLKPTMSVHWMQTLHCEHRV